LAEATAVREAEAAAAAAAAAQRRQRSEYKPGKLSAEEKAARLAAMMGDAAEHDRQRQERLHQVRGVVLAGCGATFVERVMNVKVGVSKCCMGIYQHYIACLRSFDAAEHDSQRQERLHQVRGVVLAGCGATCVERFVNVKLEVSRCCMWIYSHCFACLCSFDAAEHDRQRQERLHQMHGGLVKGLQDTQIAQTNATECSTHVARRGPHHHLC
jgi:uncharacterized protein YcaQ